MYLFIAIIHLNIHTSSLHILLLKFIYLSSYILISYHKFKLNIYLNLTLNKIHELYIQTKIHYLTILLYKYNTYSYSLYIS